MSVFDPHQDPRWPKPGSTFEVCCAAIRKALKPNQTYMALCQAITRAIQPASFGVALRSLHWVASELDNTNQDEFAVSLSAVREAVYFIKDNFVESDPVIECQKAYWAQIDKRRPQRQLKSLL